MSPAAHVLILLGFFNTYVRMRGLDFVGVDYQIPSNVGKYPPVWLVRRHPATLGLPLITPTCRYVHLLESAEVRVLLLSYSA